MKIVNTANVYHIYDDDVKTYDQLPAQCYNVRFDKMTGFFLEKHSDIEVKESKIYGVHLNKVHKVVNSFEISNRNLGVILSGDKGIGKSLFAKLLAIEAVNKGVPVIIVDRFIPGIAAYIESIEQEVMVLFDEFDKTFGDIKSGENETDAQSSMLTLFDGMAQGKKLFVITCNNIRKLSDYLVNRPGRFLYHFRFEYPSTEEVREYLQDKLAEKFWGEIDKVITFSKKVKLNYDCLRAIAFELSLGESFEDAIQDLNIVNLDTETYVAILHFEDGKTLKAEKNLDLFAEDEACIYFHTKEDYIRIEFDTMDVGFNAASGVNVVTVDKLDVEYGPEEKEMKDKVISHMSLRHKAAKTLHYTV